MITTIPTLKRARDRWLGAGRDPRLLDDAISALDSAVTNVDAIRTLGPRYAVKNLGSTRGERPGIYGIYADGELMLKYELRENPADADIEILP